MADADDDRSSYSQFYSTSTPGAGVAVEINVQYLAKKVESVCRICHLSLSEEGDGISMELGCCCKGDLGAAHSHCAQTWFQIKGNRICEICNCTARNVLGTNEHTDVAQHSNENTNSATEPTVVSTASEPQRFWQGRRFLNLLLACMVFAFVISWLFHFKVPS